MTGAPTSETGPTGSLDAVVAADAATGEVLLSEEAISQRIAAIGQQITDDYAGRSPLLIVVLKGAVLFASDLSRAIDLPIELDFMAVSSYGASTRSSGVVRMLKDLDRDITGLDVILVEDIVDSGLTLQYLRRNLNARHPASLRVCSLLVRERSTAEVDYVGFKLPDVFVVGYGLDVDERYRNLGDIRAYHVEGH